MLPRQNLAGTIIVLAGCWPKNELDETELAYCLSAGYLLGSAFVLQLQPRYLCVPESASVSSYTCTHNNVPGISHSSSVNARKHDVNFRGGNLCGVDRTHTGGGVIEQTETALRKYRYLAIIIIIHPFHTDSLIRIRSGSNPN